MKKTILVLFIPLLALKISAQQNTFPSNGNVGIGTNSPNVKLEVKGATTIEQETWLKGNLKTTNLQNLPLALPTNNGNVTANQTEYYRIYIDQNGNIIRGTEKLILMPWLNDPCMELADPSGPSEDPNNPGGSGGNGGNGGGNPVGDGVAKLNLGDGLFNKRLTEGNNRPSMWKYHQNNICVCSETKIGIGTCLPRVALDVFGTSYSQKIAVGNINPSTIGNVLFHVNAPATFSSSDKLISINGSNSELLSVKNNGDLTTKNIYADGNLFLSSGSFVFNTNLNENQNSKVFIVQNNGRKIFQLNNNGLLQARQLKVNLETSSWADYVFKPDYKLMSLESFEKFIKDKGHLPNVPTEKTIQEDGIDIGEMNRILLEKVEELTLHLIEQDKKIKILEKQITNK